MTSAFNVKYTMSSVTFSRAAWLLSALILGLDSTLALPKDSSRRTAALICVSPPALAKVGVNETMLGMTPLIGTPDGMSPPAGPSWNMGSPRRNTVQLMPCWYWSDRLTSTMVASIITCRPALSITLSMNSRMRRCWRNEARTEMTPVSGLAMTDAASRKRNVVCSVELAAPLVAVEPAVRDDCADTDPFAPEGV